MRAQMALMALVVGSMGDCSTVTAKVDCGYSGITKDQCVAKGCCWKPVDPNPNNDPWCIKSDGPAPPPTPPTPPSPPAPIPPGDTCELPDSVKTDCAIGSKDACTAAGCCWHPVSPNPNNYPWCFHPAPPPAPTPQPTPIPPLPPGAQPFSPEEQETMKGFFFKNIDLYGTGLVVAAPDNATGGGSYWYHWMRDGALTMRSVLENFPWADSEPRLKDYLKMVTHSQTLTDPNGYDVRGEPKFMIPTGDVFTGGWCRPQNDGVGIRAGTLSLFGLQLIADGQTDFAKSSVWPIITHDLDYAEQVWNVAGCDLWEEVRAPDFYWQYSNTRRGFLLAAELADKLGDSAKKSKYTGLAATVAVSMKNHTTDGYIYETACCNRQKDVAALLGVLHDDPTSPVFGFSSSEVAKTIKTLDDVFTTMFPINVNQAAKFYGRYQGDSYAGGNPWVLGIAARAQALYRGAAELAKLSETEADDGRLEAWRSVLGDSAQLSTKDDLVRGISAAGDAVLVRLREYVGALGFHLPEQLDKTSGKLANVHDLTWSYAALFDCLRFRSATMAVLNME